MPDEDTEILLGSIPINVDNYARYAWYGLASYVFLVDVALGVTGKKYMTDAWREALSHPRNRWLLIAAWGFTTKHLFFGNFLPWLDPFSIIAKTVKAISLLSGV